MEQRVVMTFRSVARRTTQRRVRLSLQGVSIPWSRQLSSTTSRMSCEKEPMVVPREEVIRYVADSMMKVGAARDDALTIGEHLFVADYRGHFSHGMNRMEMYVQDVRKKLTDPCVKPEIIHDCQAVATVDGKNGFGQVNGKFSMLLAMEKAKEFGIGMVACRGSNHYGIAGFYSLMAVQEGLIGFSCTNTSPLMAPTRSKVAALGTNPLSLGAPALNGDEFLLDMATTCVALGKIELAIRKGLPIPSGWALGEDGKPTSDGPVAFKAARLMPLGGEETHSGYKGYGLALMVEVLCGVLTGSNFGPNIRKWTDGTRVANLGHSFMAIDPEKFVPGSKERLSELLGQLRELPKADEEPVFVAGDPERVHMRKVDEDGGITYHENQLKASEEFAKQIGVEPMRLIKRRDVCKS